MSHESTDRPLIIDVLLAWVRGIERLTYGQASLLLAFSTILIVIADSNTIRHGIYLAPLYVVPVCLSAWRLGWRAGMMTAFISAILPLGAAWISGVPLAVASTLANLTLNVSALTLVVTVVNGLRLSFEQASLLASSDQMTGALNKAAFEENANMLVMSARATSQTLILAFMDLDGFKAVNDRYGHSAGDGILQSFAEAARSQMRIGDCFGRVGGDEFAVLAPVSSIEEGQKMAFTLHRRLSEALAADPTHAVTCSMGALIIPPDHGRTLATLMRHTDQLMYAVKHSGKNAVNLAVAEHDGLEADAQTVPNQNFVLFVAEDIRVAQ